MKVTKPKLAKRPVSATRVNSSVSLPAQLKKKLENSRGAGLVLFEENDHGRWADLLNQEQEVVISAKDTGKIFNIRLAESPLDVYRSPHLIDLSRKRRSDLATSFHKPAEFGYDAMPGGQFLAKYHVLDFWDFQQSEIIIAAKKHYARLKAAYVSIFDRPEFSPLLAGEKQAKIAQSHLEEVTVIGLLLFFADFYYKIYLSGYRIFLVSRLMLQKYLAKDETIWLPQSKTATSPQMAALMDRLIAASHEPTISELLKPADSTSAVPKEIVDGKFKIINPSPNRKKEIQEKYLSDNFTRKGVVVTTQKPAAFWPKDSWSWDLGNFAFSRAALKPVAVFLGVLIALMSSVKVMSYWDDINHVKGRVMGEAEQALTSINSAASDLKSLDFNAAREKFSAANSNFVSAQKQLEEIKSFLTTLAEIAPAENTFKSGTNIIDMGEHLSNAAGVLLSSVNEASGNSELSLASRVKNLSLALLPALDELKAAKINADKIGLNNLPAEQKSKFIKLKAALPEAIAGLQRLTETSAFAVKVLGDNDVRRYLLVFQNDNELRATGGFMGSFALVDLRGGKIDKITIPEGGTYDVRAGFNQLIAPPEPLRIVTDRWEFHDANWWPDYPTSAQNIKWFYEKSGGPTVDGIIAVNSSFLGKLLRITGSIDLPQYGKVITADNFEDELQKSIEREAKEKTKPKKILGELAPILMDRLLNAEPKQIFNLAEALSSGLKQRSIQLYFTDSELQKFSQDHNWAGVMGSPAGSDFLSVNANNIGGGKTDSVIKQKIYHSAEIQPDGTVIDTVLIERRNIGPTDDFFTTIANNSYLRVYVPQGSELIHAEGFKGFTADKFKVLTSGVQPKDELAAEDAAYVDPASGTKIYNENGKTVFANWSITGPGEQRDILLVYRLPFKVSFSDAPKNLIEQAADYFSSETAAYSWKFQKQSGRDSDEVKSEVSFAGNLNLKLSYPESAVAAAGKVSLSGLTDVDKYLIAGFTKK